MIAQKAIEAATPSMRQLAEQAGVNYSTLKAWSAGIRNPSPENARKLADALRQQGGEVSQLAEELKDAAGDGVDAS